MARILVIDDDEAMRMTMAALLRTAGHTVVEAKAARIAIELHRAKPVDVIVTDLVMKDMDGTELLRRIQAFSPQTPIIAVSGARQGKIYLNMAKLLGAARILAKPIEPQVLIGAVAHVLAEPAADIPTGTANP